MNIIYVNEQLQYREAFPDRFGKVTIPERNLIVAFIDKGLQYAIKDENNNIITPFEAYCQFNDLSMNLIQPNHFQRENRVIDLSGQQFCEKNELFACMVLNGFDTWNTRYFEEFEIEQGIYSHQTLYLGRKNGVPEKPVRIFIEKSINNSVVGFQNIYPETATVYLRWSGNGVAPSPEKTYLMSFWMEGETATNSSRVVSNSTNNVGTTRVETFEKGVGVTTVMADINQEYYETFLQDRKNTVFIDLDDLFPVI